MSLNLLRKSLLFYTKRSKESAHTKPSMIVLNEYKNDVDLAANSVDDEFYNSETPTLAPTVSFEPTQSPTMRPSSYFRTNGNATTNSICILSFMIHLEALSFKYGGTSLDTVTINAASLVLSKVIDIENKYLSYESQTFTSTSFGYNFIISLRASIPLLHQRYNPYKNDPRQYYEDLATNFTFTKCCWNDLDNSYLQIKSSNKSFSSARNIIAFQSLTFSDGSAEYFDATPSPTTSPTSAISHSASSYTAITIIIISCAFSFVMLIFLLKYRKRFEWIDDLYAVCCYNSYHSRSNSDQYLSSGFELNDVFNSEGGTIKVVVNAVNIQPLAENSESEDTQSYHGASNHGGRISIVDEPMVNLIEVTPAASVYIVNENV